MLTRILDKYNPKQFTSHGVLKFFSENLTEQENIQFIGAIFKYGSWVLPTEISKLSKSTRVKEVTEKKFHKIFELWVNNRIEFTHTIPSHVKNPYVTKNLHLEFREALLSIRNLNFPINLLILVDDLITSCNQKYLQAFYRHDFSVIIEQFTEVEIERFLTYFAKRYCLTHSTVYQDFFYHFLSTLVYSHKIFGLSTSFIVELDSLSSRLRDNFTPKNYRLLVTILLIDFIEKRKLDLNDSKFKLLIESSMLELNKGDYDNLDFFRFLKRFNYSFLSFDVASELQILIEKLDDAAVRLQKKTNLEKQRFLHHFLSSSNQYFELFLFYQELRNEYQAQKDFVLFINVIDKIRLCFSSMLWYDEFLDIKPLRAKMFAVTREGFEVKIKDAVFSDAVSKLGLSEEVNAEFISHLGFGFLHKTALGWLPNTKDFLNRIIDNRNFKYHVLTAKESIELSEVETFFISKLNYSEANKKNVLIFCPYKESIDVLVTKYKLKGFFPSIELYLIEKAHEILKIASPFNGKESILKLLSPPNFFHNYQMPFSDEQFWCMLREVRPFLYESIYQKFVNSEFAFNSIKQAYQNDLEVSGRIIEKAKGGLVVEVLGMRGFLPGSQIDVKPVSDFESYIGLEVPLKIVTINKDFNFVVSRRSVIEQEFNQKRQQILDKLKIGQIVDGIVKNITDYGVFVDFGGVHGLVHKYDLSWSSYRKPDHVARINQAIRVVILDFDNDKKRIALGLKQLEPHPWKNLNPSIKPGEKMKGKIIAILDYGLFVELIPGIEGLVHVSEISWNRMLKNPQDIFVIGDEVNVLILTIDKDEQKLSLSIKQMITDPWDSVEKYTIGERYKAKLCFIQSYGVFAELENGIVGLIHISKLKGHISGKDLKTKRVLNTLIDVKILSRDKDNRKIELMPLFFPDKKESITRKNGEITTDDKHLINGIRIGRIDRITKTGAIILFKNNTTAFCPHRHLIKADGGKATIGEELNFKIIEVNERIKRIIASHSCTFDLTADYKYCLNRKKGT